MSSNVSQLRSRYDVVIVGARCAGASTAMLLARSGLHVLAVDKSSYGSDALSTHGLMRGGVLQLQRWGVLPAIVAAGTPPVRAASFQYGDQVTEVPIRARGAVDALYAPRRTVLDRALVDAARAAGADVRHRVAVVELVEKGGRICGVDLVDRSGHLARVEADLVVGADGLRSKIADAVGATVVRSGAHATAIVFGYWGGVSLDRYAWYYRPGLAGGVLPTNGGEACVFVAVPSHRLLPWITHDLAGGFMQAAAELSPSLAGALEAGWRSGALRTFAGAPGFLRRAHGPGWALVGDAGYFKDPITAHGITDALRDAELLARAIVRGPHCLREYEAMRDDLSTEMLDLSDAIASFDWDLDRVAALHDSLHREMKREAQAIEELDAGMAAE